MFIIVILIMSIISNTVLAETPSSIYSSNEIEALVRTKLDIGSEIKLNHSNLYTQDSREKKLWNLEFGDEKANMYVTVDAETGEIANYHSWGSEMYGKPVAILPAAAKESAVKFIQSLEPDKFNETEEVTVEAPSMIIYQLRMNYYEPNNYHFLFVRKMKGEYFPNNFFRVQVSGSTGKVVQYEMKWDEVTYDNNKALLSVEQARKIFEKDQRLQLKYVRLYNNNKDEAAKPVLTPVYIYTQKESDKINAIDGKLYKMEELYNHWPDYRPMYATGMENMTKEAMAYDRAEVIPEKGVLSKEKVERIVLDTLGKQLDLTGLRVQSSHYTNYYFGTKGKYWNVYWWDEETGKSLHAVLEAGSGEIISAGYSKPMDYEGPVDIERLTLIKMDVAAGIIPMEAYEKVLQEVHNKPQESNITNIDENKLKKEVLDKIRKIFPHIKEEEVKFEVHSNTAKESLVHLSSSRLINGIPYDENYLNVTYQYNTGEIVKFDYQWNQVVAQPASKVVDKKVIEKQFYDKVGFEKYLLQLKDQNAAKKEGKNVPLKQLVPVYGLKTFDFAFIDAVTGKYLAYDGKEYVEEPSTIEGFKDIKNHPYEKEILLMDKMSILKENSSSFRPNDTLTRKDAVKWIVEMGWKGRTYYLDGYYDYYQKMTELPFKDIDKNDPYYVYILAAVENGIIQEKGDYFKPEEKMTKLEVTKWILNAMKQKELAQFTEIFQVSYTDKEEIQPEDIGYVALAKYYNIYGDKSGIGAFKPNQIFTRGEFIKALYNMLNNQ